MIGWTPSHFIMLKKTWNYSVFFWIIWDSLKPPLTKDFTQGSFFRIHVKNKCLRVISIRILYFLHGLKPRLKQKILAGVRGRRKAPLSKLQERTRGPSPGVTGDQAKAWRWQSRGSRCHEANRRAMSPCHPFPSGWRSFPYLMFPGLPSCCKTWIVSS